MKSQSHSILWRHNSNINNVIARAREWDRNRFEIYVSALELMSISSCTMADTWMFDSGYIMGSHMKVFQLNLAYFIATYIAK